MLRSPLSYLYIFFVSCQYVSSPPSYMPINMYMQTKNTSDYSPLQDINRDGVNCAFHKHANSKIQKPSSPLRFSLPSNIITITSNEP